MDPAEKSAWIRWNSLQVESESIIINIRKISPYEYEADSGVLFWLTQADSFIITIFLRKFERVSLTLPDFPKIRADSGELAPEANSGGIFGQTWPE